MVPKDNDCVLVSVWYHIRVMFDCEETHQWNGPGGSMCSKLLIILDGDILPHFHLKEAVILLFVAIKENLVIS